MSIVRILLCHPSDWVANEMQEAVHHADADANCKLVSDLTEAYNFVEHRQPACLIISAYLAQKPEFELLGALLNQLNIGCIIWGNLAGRLPPPSPPNLLHCSGHLSINDFRAMLKSAMHTAPASNGSKTVDSVPRQGDPHRIILIGASTGGVDALTRVLVSFSQQSPPTLIVQHTGGRFAPSLIRLLDRATSATVLAASDGQRLQKGHVYLSPGDHVHLSLSKTARRVIALDEGAAVSGHRPSVDVLFHSAVGYGPHVSAALLTGMGQDGASGLKALRDAGARTIAQDQATSVVYGMPRIAAQLGAAMLQLPIDAIGPRLIGLTQTRAIA